MVLTDKYIQVSIEDLIFHPENSVFKAKSDEFIKLLAKDIETHGLKEPIEINERNMILSGENRVKAHKLLGRTSILCQIVKVENELEYIISRNVGRRQIAFNDRVLIYRKVFPKIFSLKKVFGSEIQELSKRLLIPKKTLESDFTKIRNGNVKAVSIEELKNKWEKNNLKGLKVSIIDMGNNWFLLKVSGKKIEYEFGPGPYKKVIKDAFDASESDLFKRENFEKGNLNLEIKKLRVEAGLTQFQLGQKIGYSQSYIAEFESGRWEVTNELYEQIREICLI
jgi:ParB-like chromosome segregation protein Spo0J